MGGSRLSPAERVRQHIATDVSRTVAGQLPTGYQRLGRVLILRLPESLRPHFRAIAEAWCRELGVEAVLRRAGEVTGEFRVPPLELIAGANALTEVREHGIRYRLDARQVLFSRGNRTERHRAGLITVTGESVADLFAGVGYFTLPAAVLGGAACVWAVEKNATSFRFLVENVALNHVGPQVECRLGDNREVDLPRGTFHRVFLGYLPSAVPWLPRALELLRPEGGTVHVHLVVETTDGLANAEAEVVRATERAGGSVVNAVGREVKAYGPGRVHVVVDLTARPQLPGTV